MFNKYSILKLYIKSIEADIKYIVISGMEEFGRILCKELKNENIKIDYVFDDYNNIDKQCFKEINFISLENLRKIADNAIILISDRDPEIFQIVFQKLKRNGIKHICPNALMKIIRLLPETEYNLYPIGHYFSLYPNIENINKISDIIFKKEKGVKDIDFNEKRQLEILDKMIKMYPTLPDWKNTLLRKEKNFRYNYENQWFGAADAIALHCILRMLKPKRFVEIGSGYSSAVVLDTNEYYLESDIKISFIEPHPERLKTLLKPEDNIKLFVKELQDIPIDFFAQLTEDDVLFVDSSHVSKIGSDVNYLIFEILPHLNKGVYIHFHDIFYPFEYPKDWIIDKGFIWNELYMLRAFLQNNKCYSIQYFQDMMLYKYNDIFEKNWSNELPAYNSLPYGASIWLKKEL